MLSAKEAAAASLPGTLSGTLSGALSDALAAAPAGSPTAANGHGHYANGTASPRKGGANGSALLLQGSGSVGADLASRTGSGSSAKLNGAASNGGASTGGNGSVPIAIGNRLLMTERGVAVGPDMDAWMSAHEENGQTCIMLSVGARAVAAMAVADPLKPEAYEVVGMLRQQVRGGGSNGVHVCVGARIVPGFMALVSNHWCCVQPTPTRRSPDLTHCTHIHTQGLRVYLLTGDNWRTALAIGRQLGLTEDEIRAEVLPGGKADMVTSLQVCGPLGWGPCCGGVVGMAWAVCRLPEWHGRHTVTSLQGCGAGVRGLCAARAGVQCTAARGVGCIVPRALGMQQLLGCSCLLVAAQLASRLHPGHYASPPCRRSGAW